MKKKLERQLLAAGIDILFDKTLNCKFIGNEKNDNTMCIDNEDDLPTFKQCKEFVQFKGNDWGGLYKRLKKDDQWEARYKNIYYYSNKYHTRGDSILMVAECELKPTKKHIPIKYNPHQIWKFLDKIDYAKSKGGKQVVKFKGREYEFNFPVVDKVADTTVIEKEVNPVIKGDHKDVIVQDCKIGNFFKKEYDTSGFGLLESKKKDTTQSLAPNGNAIHLIGETKPIPPIKYFLGFTECDNIKPYWELTDEQTKVLTNKDVLFIVEGASDGKWVAKYMKAEETNKNGETSC